MIRESKGPRGGGGLNFDFNIGDETFNSGNDKDMRRSERKQKLDTNFGFDIGNYESDPKQNKMLNKKLGPAPNPFEAIIQGLAFRNPSTKGRANFPYKARDLNYESMGKRSMMSEGYAPERRELMMPMSNYLRSFISALVQAKSGMRR